MKRQPKLRTAEDAKKLLLGVELPAADLAIRILEAYHGMRRPHGLTPVQALQALDERDRAGALRAAAVAVHFFAECVSRTSGVQ